jgi:hypothetical protein
MKYFDPTYFLTLAGGAFLIAYFAKLMAEVCGRYNQFCGGSLQWWQLGAMIGLGILPSIVLFVSRKL